MPSSIKDDPSNLVPRLTSLGEPDTVMAEQAANHVVNEVLSVDGPASIDVTASTTQTASAGHGQVAVDPTTATASNLNDNTIAPNSANPSFPTDALKQPTSVSGIHMETDIVAGTNFEFPQAASDAQPGASPSNALPNGQGDPVARAENSTTPVTVTAEGSAGSDTDTSKPESLQKDGSAQHSRTNSVKKPITFKKTSVTKSFLAKTASSPSPKLAEKGENGRSSRRASHAI
jgi:hypothetical protein